MKRKWITFLRIIHTGIVNFIRNLSLAVAAIAVMVVTLTIVLFSVIANATFTNTIASITNRIDISVYLKDTNTEVQNQNLVSKITKLPNTKSVQYLDKKTALQRYINQNAGNQALLIAVSQTNNPIPATILVKPNDLNRIQDLKTFLSSTDNKALQSDEASYSGDRKQAIDKITGATNTLRKIGVTAVAIFTVICALIIFNTIQMAIFNRRDEITIMRLLGAKTSYIRGPFIVESAIYGILAAVLSLLIINGLFLASNNALQATSLGLLDINYASTFFSENFWKLLGLQLMVGTIIGVVSSVIATRRYLKFKTK
ncbi:FtsX-like permease family protein [Candidatus Saccharibacteria bacterium]|nr:FtsX-like permease family protein [Candidatus Saccharibacteria bacterium]